MALPNDHLNDLFRAFLVQELNAGGGGSNVTVSNLPTVQTVSFSTSITANFPLVQTVSWTGGQPLVQTITQFSTISTVNSTTVALGANASFVGTSEDALLYNSVSVLIFSSADSATDGLYIEQSIDNSNWDIADYMEVKANQAYCFRVGLVAEYFRVGLINSSTTQTTLRLETRKSPAPFHLETGRSNAPSKFSILGATVASNVAVVSAPGTSKSILLRSISATNDSATINRAAIKDGTTSFYEMVTAANGGGFVKEFRNGRVLTVNTALNAALATALTTTYITAEYVTVKV